MQLHLSPKQDNSFFIKYLKSAGRENVSLWRMDELIWRFRHSSKSLGRLTNQMMRTMLRYIINCSLIGKKLFCALKFAEFRIPAATTENYLCQLLSYLWSLGRNNKKGGLLYFLNFQRWLTCNFSLRFQYIILQTVYENSEAHQLVRGCYLDLNKINQLTRKGMEVNWENISLDLWN